MRTILILTFLAFIQSSVQTQEHCNNDYYTLDSLFQVDTIKDVLYGNNNTLSGANRDLFLDVYTPISINQKTPLVVFAHGGSFISGNRQLLSTYCHKLSTRGFTVATIDYRLLDVFFGLDSSDIAREVIFAVSDMKAAIRHFVEDANNQNTYNIDTNFIFVGGVSAGAITATHVAFLDSNDNIDGWILDEINSNGGFTGNSSNNTGLSFNIKGLINYSGGILNTDWINNNNINFYSAHTSEDETVTCETGFPGLVSTGLFPAIELSGSCAMHNAVTNPNIQHEFYFLDGVEGHTDYLFTEEFHKVINDAAVFLKYTMCSFPPTSVKINDVEKVTVKQVKNQLLIDVTQPTNFELYSISGKLIEVFSIQNSESYSIKNLSDGFYIIKSSTSDFTYKLSIMR